MTPYPHYQEIKKKLGKACDIILDSVRGGKLTFENITSFAQVLGKDDDPNKLFGNHRQRMEENRERRYSTQMKDILSDFHNLKVFDKSKEETLNLLINAFNDPDVDQRPLANELKKHIAEHADSTTTTHSAEELRLSVPWMPKVSLGGTCKNVIKTQDGKCKTVEQSINTFRKSSFHRCGGKLRPQTFKHSFPISTIFYQG